MNIHSAGLGTTQKDLLLIHYDHETLARSAVNLIKHKKTIDSLAFKALAAIVLHFDRIGSRCPDHLLRLFVHKCYHTQDTNHLRNTFWLFRQAGIQEGSSMGSLVHQIQEIPDVPLPWTREELAEAILFVAKQCKKCNHPITFSLCLENGRPISLKRDFPRNHQLFSKNKFLLLPHDAINALHHLSDDPADLRSNDLLQKAVAIILKQIERMSHSPSSVLLFLKAIHSIPETQPRRASTLLALITRFGALKSQRLLTNAQIREIMPFFPIDALPIDPKTEFMKGLMEQLLAQDPTLIQVMTDNQLLQLADYNPSILTQPQPEQQTMDRLLQLLDNADVKRFFILLTVLDQDNQEIKQKFVDRFHQLIDIHGIDTAIEFIKNTTPYENRHEFYRQSAWQYVLQAIPTLKLDSIIKAIENCRLRCGHPINPENRLIQRAITLVQEESMSPQQAIELYSVVGENQSWRHAFQPDTPQETIDLESAVRKNRHELLMLIISQLSGLIHVMEGNQLLKFLDWYPATPMGMFDLYPAPKEIMEAVVGRLAHVPPPVLKNSDDYRTIIPVVKYLAELPVHTPETDQCMEKMIQSLITASKKNFLKSPSDWQKLLRAISKYQWVTPEAIELMAKHVPVMLSYHYDEVTQDFDEDQDCWGAHKKTVNVMAHYPAFKSLYKQYGKLLAEQLPDNLAQVDNRTLVSMVYLIGSFSKRGPLLDNAMARLTEELSRRKEQLNETLVPRLIYGLGIYRWSGDLMNDLVSRITTSPGYPLMYALAVSGLRGPMVAQKMIGLAKIPKNVFQCVNIARAIRIKNLRDPKMGALMITMFKLLVGETDALDALRYRLLQEIGRYGLRHAAIDALVVQTLQKTREALDNFGADWMLPLAFTALAEYGMQNYGMQNELIRTEMVNLAKKYFANSNGDDSFMLKVIEALDTDRLRCPALTEAIEEYEQDLVDGVDDPDDYQEVFDAIKRYRENATGASSASSSSAGTKRQRTD